MTPRAGLQAIRLERKSLGDEVYETLRKMIVRQQLAPGEKIAEGALAGMLGVSRTPVREALQHLEYEGWVILQPGHSPRVAPMTTKKAEGIYPLIAVLERVAVRQGLAHLTEADLGRMEQLTDAMERHGQQREVEQVVAADAEFHAVLHQRSQNEWLQRIVGDLRRHMERLEYTFFSEPSVLQGSLERHRALVRLLRRGDAQAAQQAIEGQWESGQQAVMEILRRREAERPQQNQGRARRARRSPGQSAQLSQEEVKQ